MLTQSTGLEPQTSGGEGQRRQSDLGLEEQIEKAAVEILIFRASFGSSKCSSNAGTIRSTDTTDNIRMCLTTCMRFKQASK